ncbi:MAG TPA: M28 family peptidase [Allosphingosinicella sp.]|nr:M28 family peptidase [Allosphingosinicella sp.]
MFKPLALLFLLLSAPLAAQPAPIAPADLLRHIRILADDSFQGRAPGSEGERLTTDYIVRELAARGLEPAGENGTWLQPLPIVETVPGASEVRWTARGVPVEIAAEDIALSGNEEVKRLTDAPVVFAGDGTRLAGVDFHGAAALVLAQAPAGSPPLRQRVRALTDAGAAAVIVVTGADVPWNLIVAGFRRGSTRLDSEPLPNIAGLMPARAAQRLLAAAGSDLGAAPAALPIRVSMEVHTDIHRFTTNNVVGRLRGSGATGENLLFLAHWDHFGFCRPEGAPDRICNGAVDNASGVAMMIEVAGGLAAGPRPPRDILFLATTAEEEGLIGAGWFAAHPTVPLGSIVAAINMDTVAIQPAGSPVAVIGRGIPALDAAIDATVAAMGRRLDNDDEAAELVQRQDGWALARAGVPAIMVGGSFSDMALLNRFLEGRYHEPNDQADGELVLDGAAEDANLSVALGRRLADPAAYRRATGGGS